MTSATRSVAVVATRLPNIDRRALSQAWFSALHLTQPAGSAGAPRIARPAVSEGKATRPGVSATTSGPSAGPASSPRAPRAAAVPTVPDRRAAAGDLARRIERAIVRAAAVRPLHTTAFAISAGDGRVQLLVRSDGATTRIVALCAPHIRERVDRALAHARFALAAAGTRLDTPQ